MYLLCTLNLNKLLLCIYFNINALIDFRKKIINKKGCEEDTA